VSDLRNVRHLTSEEILYRNISNFWFSWLNGENVKYTGDDGPILNLTALKRLNNRNSIEIRLIPRPETFLRTEWS
jgi:hypothetical protein